MTDAQAVQWLTESGVSQALQSTSWLFPMLEALHFIGLCVLVGSILLVDLRLLGFIREAPVRSTLRFIPIAILGFAVVLGSGLALFLTDPAKYWVSMAFRAKMALVVLGGANALWFELAERRKVLLLPNGADTETSAKVVASVSLCTWVVVIALGRLLPYLDVEGG